jgi:hypothetical protein
VLELGGCGAVVRGLAKESQLVEKEWAVELGGIGTCTQVEEECVVVLSSGGEARSTVCVLERGDRAR